LLSETMFHTHIEPHATSIPYVDTKSFRPDGSWFTALCKRDTDWDKYNLKDLRFSRRNNPEDTILQNLKGFGDGCITLRIKGVPDFVHRPQL
jgi:hypothetical protein